MPKTKGWRARPRPSSLSIQQHFDTLAEMQRTPYPKHPEVLRHIVDNLLKIFDAHDPALAQALRLQIMAIAAKEKYPSTLAKNWYRLEGIGHFEDLFADELAQIRTGKRIASRHYVELLRLQHALLNAYVAQHPADVFDTLWTWFNQHANSLYPALALYPCLCRYPESFRLTEEEVLDCRGMASLLLAILSDLHPGLQPSSIRQYLKSTMSASSLIPLSW